MTLGWENPTADPTTTILLRHGDTQLSPEHRFSGLRDLPLSAIGTRQAQAAACRLATGAPIDAVVSSPLQRAVATAAIAAANWAWPQSSMMISGKPTSVTGMASPWPKSSSDGPQPRQPGDATPNRHRRAGRASPTPHTG